LKAVAPVKPMDEYIAQEIMMESQMTWLMLVNGCHWEDVIDEVT
jgi:hypothetical protein